MVLPVHHGRWFLSKAPSQDPVSHFVGWNPSDSRPAQQEMLWVVSWRPGSSLRGSQSQCAEPRPSRHPNVCAMCGGVPCLLLSFSSNLNVAQHFLWTAPCLSSPCLLVVDISQLTLHFQIPVVISLRCKLDAVVLRLKNPLISPPPMKSKWLPTRPKGLQDLPRLHLYAHSRGAFLALWWPPPQVSLPVR